MTSDPLPFTDEDRHRLYALMDMLSAVQIDLAKLSRSEVDGSPSAGSIIDQACSILRAASEDLGDVIRRVEGPAALRQVDLASRLPGERLA